MKIEILPSLLAADFGRLADEILRAEASGAEALHLDIMDAHFVPNLSFGPDVVALAKRTAPGFYRNVHLMMSRPDLYLEKFAAAGAETIQVHVEADCNLHVELKRIRELGLKNAIVLNPETPVERLAPYLDEIDEALVMTVHPGYGGQKLIERTLDKAKALRKYISENGLDIDIEMDGGIKIENVKKVVEAGVNVVVAGTGVFRGDMAENMKGFRAVFAEVENNDKS